MSIFDFKVPTTEAEALETMARFARDYDGGFHPEDDPRDIINTSGQNVFNEQEAVHYDAVMGAVWDLLEDPCLVALRAIQALHGE